MKQFYVIARDPDTRLWSVYPEPEEREQATNASVMEKMREFSRRKMWVGIFEGSSLADLEEALED